MTLALPVAERGGQCDIEFRADGTVYKLSQKTFTESGANRVADLLWRYADALASEPVPSAAFRGAEVVPDDAEPHRFRVAHSMDIVFGESIKSLPDLERRQAISFIIGDISSMSLLSPVSRPGALQVPLDAANPKNWHMNGSTPTLIDIYMPLVRSRSGRIAYFEGQQASSRSDNQLGDLRLLVPDLLLRAYSLEQNPGDLEQWAVQILGEAAMPPSVRPTVESAVAAYVR